VLEKLAILERREMVQLGEMKEMSGGSSGIDEQSSVERGDCY